MKKGRKHEKRRKRQRRRVALAAAPESNSAEMRNRIDRLLGKEAAAGEIHEKVGPAFSAGRRRSAEPHMNAQGEHSYRADHSFKPRCARCCNRQKLNREGREGGIGGAGEGRSFPRWSIRRTNCRRRRCAPPPSLSEVCCGGGVAFAIFGRCAA